MSSSWQPEASPAPDDRLPVATFRAVLGLEVEQSVLKLVSGIDRQMMVSAITTPPEWCPISWPILLNETEEELRRFALLKIQLFFDFGSNSEAETADDIQSELSMRFSRLYPSDISVQTDHFGAISIDATIWSDGTVDGGFEYPGESMGFSIGEDTVDDLEFYVKNHMRADIRRALSSSRP